MYDLFKKEDGGIGWEVEFFCVLGVENWLYFVENWFKRCCCKVFLFIYCLY